MASPHESDLSESDTLESPSSETVSPLESPSDADLTSPPLPRNAATAHAAIPTTTANMTSSSTPLGPLNAARRPPQATMNRSGQGLPPDLAAKMRNMVVGRNAPPSAPSPGRSFSAGVGAGPPSPAPNRLPGGVPSSFLPPSARPQPTNFNSAPAVAGVGAKPSLAEKRGMAMPGGLPSAPPSASQAPQAPAGGRRKPMMKLSDIGGGASDPPAGGKDQEGGEGKAKENGGSLLDKYSDYIDVKTGSLMFKGKATLTNRGVEFESGKSFSISLDEVDTLDELGKGNYGTVYKVRHSRPRIRRPGLGLAGNKALPGQQASPTTATFGEKSDATSGMVMAMKEIRLELDDAKFAAIIMELDILHRCVSPFIVDFYGAFFQEGAVYICMEYMDGGSIDKLYGDGIPESVLRKIALATTMGLKSLKEEHNIIHRDVKPTNILVNTHGQVKICDFGVSGNLVASIAKTNIGCQSYMAPERISSGGVAQAGANPGGGTYSVQSDIWSLGLTIIECAMGQYPYPPETYDNIFSQLSAIVDGEPPDLPATGFSEAAHDFVRGCLAKIPNLRPSYAMLLQHAWFAPLLKPPTIAEEDEEAAEAGAEMPTSGGGGGAPDAPASTEDPEVAAWVARAIERKRQGLMGKKAQPALHAAPLDATGSPGAEKSGE